MQQNNHNVSCEHEIKEWNDTGLFYCVKCGKGEVELLD